MILLPYPISSNRYWRVSRNIVHLSIYANNYKKQIANIFKYQKSELMLCPVELSIILHPKTNKDGSECKTRVDLDNALKVLIDALKGIAYKDDKQVVKITAELGKPIKFGGVSLGLSNPGQREAR